MPTVAAKKKKAAPIAKGKHAAAVKPKRTVVEDDDDDDDDEAPVKAKTTKRMENAERYSTGKKKPIVENPREFYDLEFKIVGNRFTLTGNFDSKGHDSSTGRSIIRATSGGLWDTGVKVAGKPVIIGFNCFTTKRD